MSKRPPKPLRAPKGYAEAIWPLIRDFQYDPDVFFDDYAGMAYSAARSGPATRPVARFRSPDGRRHEVEVDTDDPGVRRMKWLAERYPDPTQISVRVALHDLVDGAVWTNRERLRVAGLWRETAAGTEIEPAFIAGLLAVTRRTDGRGFWLDKDEVAALIARLARPPGPGA